MTFFAVFNHWLHLVSAILWMGGVAFQVFISMPFLKSVDPAHIQGMAHRFRHLVNPLLLILLVTGGINFGVRRGSHDFMPVGYISALGTKVLLVAAAASIHFITQFLPVSPTNESSKPSLSRPGDTLTKITLILGLIIIFLASMLRHWELS